MGNWRRDHRENFQQEWHPITSVSNYKKPPSGWSGQPTVPSWEKRSCTSVCKIPCEKIYESQIFLSSHQKVMEWNDSAGQEALQNAKTSFWAEINGPLCYVPLPNPNLYIDVIDWSSSVDPKLLPALDGKRTVSEHDEDDRERQLQYAALWNQPIIPTGWGDDIYDNPVIKPSSAMGPMGPR
ncbi:hypothetical protein CKAN_01555100 [Cinnamomum micranthum f. kanehirae]|uniref:Uncharacterized protein n=1 Tax=Cinnamomum micranthum f. kanehirae TaxID=337451 RepID=A0A3S3NFJ9_9MAGN|nr:hypothetical protein CKAN_01555100 [Cinnamomum micranthum f. kanehirae]